MPTCYDLVVSDQGARHRRITRASLKGDVSRCEGSQTVIQVALDFQSVTINNELNTRVWKAILVSYIQRRFVFMRVKSAMCAMRGVASERSSRACRCTLRLRLYVRVT